jgi:hypothetical protein
MTTMCARRRCRTETCTAACASAQWRRRGGAAAQYVALYHMLFAPRRATTYNVTELGVASGQSLQLWADYFPSARVNGFDPASLVPVVRRHFASQPRVRLFTLDAYHPRTPAEAGLSPYSQDVVIDDARHEQARRSDHTPHTLLLLLPSPPHEPAQPRTCLRICTLHTAPTRTLAPSPPRVLGLSAPSPRAPSTCASSRNPSSARWPSGGRSSSQAASTSSRTSRGTSTSGCR